MHRSERLDWMTTTRCATFGAGGDAATIPVILATTPAIVARSAFRDAAAASSRNQDQSSLSRDLQGAIMLAPFATPFFSATAGLHLSWEVPEPAATLLPRRVAPLCPLLLRSFFHYQSVLE